MKKYQICEVTNNKIYHAASKAPSDIEKIAEELDFEKLYIIRNPDSNDLISKIRRQKNYFYNWKKVYDKIEKGSILLLQHPFRMRQMGREFYIDKLKRKKSVKIISLIHDVESLRKTLFNDYYKDEFNYMLRVADIFIVHNDSMRNYFIQRGVSQDKIVTLDIFDYLRNDYSSMLSKFDKSVIIAGNLDIKKAAYLNNLNKINVFFNLYGLNYTLHSYKNCKYHGSLPTSEIPSVLNKGFGLIWDGIDIKSCVGPTGNYLRYNNPHKLSLYLASNLPVIIWNEAAEAKFVKKYNLGITISSLLELPEIFDKLTLDEYNTFAHNVLKIAPQIVSGEYTLRALNEAIKIIEED